MINYTLYILLFPVYFILQPFSMDQDARSSGEAVSFVCSRPADCSVMKWSSIKCDPEVRAGT